MKRLPKFFFSFILLSIGISGYSQSKATISGYIKDVETIETLIGASVYLKEKQVGTATNTYGFYSLTADTGKYTLVFPDSFNKKHIYGYGASV